MRENDLPLFEAATRHGDYSTSVAAGDAIRPITGRIALEVIAFASKREPWGFIDDDLKRAHPSSPESSYRKRRTELTQHGYLVSFGEERMNRHGRNELVWHLTEKGKAFAHDRSL